MKKILIYIIVALAGVFSVFSCVQPLEPGVRGGTGAYSLDLSVSCLAPATKVDGSYPNGVGRLNENKIDFVDWFIFRDTTSGTAWKSGRVTFSDKPDGTTEFSVKTLDMSEFMGTATTASGYVFAVANYPSENGHEVFDGKSFQQIRQMSYVTAELKSQLGVNDRNRKFQKLDNFVMTSAAEPFTLTEAVPSVTVNAKLSRQLAKISLNISIVPYIDEVLAHTSGLDTNWVEYKQTWYPDVKNIRVYLTYANSKGTLSPVTTETDRELVAEYDESTFFTYNSYGFVPEITYRNDNVQDTAYVAGSPFYSYPMRWETSDEHAPFIKIILPWKPVVESDITRNVPCNYINHETGGVIPGQKDVVNRHSFPSDVSTGSQKFYYKISLPSENDFLRSNVWTRISLDVALLGGKEEETEVEVAGRYYVLNWSDPGVVAGGDLTAGKYLSLATPRDTFYMYGDTLEVPVLSSHILALSGTPTATYKTYKPVGIGTLTYSNTDSTGTNFTVRTYGSSTITVAHKLETELNNMEAKDIAPITYSLTIKHADNDNYQKSITVIQYPAIYVDAIESSASKTFLNGTVYPTRSTTPKYNNVNNSRGSIGSIGRNGAAPTGTTNTIVTVTSLASVNVQDYEDNGIAAPIIGDPRILLGGNYPTDPDPQISNRNATWLQTDFGESPYYLDNYRYADMDKPNVIAPRILLASGYGSNRGATGEGGYWISNAQRCAAYQENGYPAGRWRLPTDAEILFLYTLASRGFIEQPFEPSSNSLGYWASSGRNFGWHQNAFLPAGSAYGSAAHSVRCVYDLWYWGGDKLSDETTWGGFQTDYINN